MIVRNKIILGTSAITLGLGLIVPMAAYAQSGESSVGQKSIVDRIAGKFNLNKDEVKKVFEEQKQSKQAEHKQVLDQKITKLVSDGKLTQDQADKIKAKLAEVQADKLADKQNIQNMSKEERKTAMEAKKTELKQWAADNNIDFKYIKPIGRGDHRIEPDKN